MLLNEIPVSKKKKWITTDYYVGSGNRKITFGFDIDLLIYIYTATQSIGSGIVVFSETAAGSPIYYNSRMQYGTNFTIMKPFNGPSVAHITPESRRSILWTGDYGTINYMIAVQY